MKIKICGLQRLEDIEYVNEAKVDFAGFIFTPDSIRCIDIQTAKVLKKHLANEIKAVGVFVNQQAEYIQEVVSKSRIDIVQLHGIEDNGFISRVKELTGKEVIKAFRADANLACNIRNTAADYILTDSYNKNSFGGTGKTFDWGLIPETDKKIFLAGGLNVSNIEKAININPYCLDINSGVETDGRKDRGKIRKIVEIIRENI